MATIETQELALSRPTFVSRLEWKRLALVCVLLGISGGIRQWRDLQFASLSKGHEAPPFPLVDFPDKLGDWEAVRGSEEVLEPDIARLAGASDYIIRKYSNKKAGKTADVMVLYGLASLVYGHVPSVCYPASGFAPRSSPRLVEIPVPTPLTSRTVVFRKERFSKGGDDRQVFHSFLNAGQWGVDMETHWKAFRYHPGMFKIQVQSAYAGESKSIEDLLGWIVQQIEKDSAPKG